MFVKKKDFGLILVLISFIVSGCNNKNTTSVDAKKEVDNVLKLGDMGELTLPDGIEARNDIPFSLLIDKEFKHKIPDSVDVNTYRPDYIVLKTGFNEKDSLQLAVFPNITVSIISSKDGNPFTLGQTMTEYLINRVVLNMVDTPYKLVEWKMVDPEFSISDSIPGLVLEYVYKNENTEKRTNINNVYVLKNGKLINIMMSSPDSNYEEWNGYMDKVISSIKFN